VERCSPLESLSPLQVPSLIRLLGQRAWPSFSLLSLEQSPGIFTTWYFGLPTSSSQALFGRLVGAAIASASTVHWMTGVVGKVIVPMILSSFVGFVGGYVDDHRLVGVA
jgi:hypothetical protein